MNVNCGDNYSLLLNKKTIVTGQFQNGGAGICCVPLLTTGNLDESKNLAKKGQSNWGGLINPVLTLHGKAPTSEIVHHKVWTNGMLDKFKCWFEVSALSSVPVRRGGGPRVKRCNSQQIRWVLGTWVSFLGASGKVLSHSWEACPAAMWSPTHLATAVQSAPVKKPAEVFGTLRLICPWNQTETLWVTVWLGLVDFGYIYMEMDGNGTCFSCSLEAVQASISACEKAAKWTIALELLLLMPLLRLFANLVPQMQRTSTGIAKLWLDSVCLRMS